MRSRGDYAWGCGDWRGGAAGGAWGAGRHRPRGTARADTPAVHAGLTADHHYPACPAGGQDPRRPRRGGGCRRAGLVRVDPRTLAETTRIPVPACPAALAAERGLVWAIDEPGRRVLRVDAASAHLTEIGLPVAPVAVAPTGGARGSFVLDRVDPRSGRLLGSFTVAQLEFGFGPQLAVGFGALWLSTFDSGELLRVDPSRM